MDALNLPAGLVTADEALRASEERWRLVFENSGVGISLAGPQGRFTAVNRAFAEMLGYTEHELLGLTFIDVTHPDDQPANIALVRQLWDGAVPQFQMEKRYRHKDGRPIWARNTVTLVPGAGRIERFSMAIHEDISERKQATDQAQGMLARLRALAAGLEIAREEERTRVSREIHDELGQALTAIKLDLDSLVRQLSGEQRGLTDKGHAILDLIDGAIRSVRRIATQLRPGILDDLGLVAAVEWAAEEFQNRTGVKVSLTTPEDLGVDPEKATAIFRIFQETLTNVARHAQASDVRVRLAHEDGHLILEVHDNGRGLPDPDLRTGTSLGILGMGERAELLGGRLSIGSHPGRGTVVALRIPVARDPVGEV